MTKLDYGRRQDLEELADSIANAKSRAEREYYEKIAYKILNESPAIKYLREELIKAARVDDRRSMQKICLRIQNVRLNETNGHSWGSNKTEKNVN